MFAGAPHTTTAKIPRMPKITTIAQMRALEAQAHAVGVSYESMMERAGTAVFDAISARLGSLDGVPVPVQLGPGNNGSGGLVKL